MLSRFRYTQPRSLAEAIERLQRRGARLHAGGTDLLGCLRDGVFGAEEVVSLSRVETLRGITPLADGGLALGALVTLTEIAESPEIRGRYPLLAEAAASAASPQLRNQGTVGGNLCQRPRCWYFRGEFHCLRKGGDTCFAVDGENRYHCIFGGDGCYIVHPSDTAPALVALDARVRIAGPGGSRVQPLESFFLLPSQNLTQENVLEPGEILTEILLPPPWSGLRSTYRKVRERGAWDFALVGVALALSVEAQRVTAARVVLSGVAPVPWRSHPAEQALVDSVIDADTARRAGEAAIQAAEPLEQNAYKVPLLKGAVEEALLSVAVAG